nr:HigA family addiction module antidote protein [Gammaproteobacteria bacterium]
MHPGEVLADELQERGLNATALARQLRVPANRITQLIAGKRNLTANTALRLGRFLGTGPELWMNLQKAYELRLAEQALKEELKQVPRAS